MHAILDPSHASAITLFQAFTPSSSSPLSVVERPQVSDAIRWAVRTPGRQLVVYGQSGTGKSTAVFGILARGPAGSTVVIRCTAETSLSSLLRSALVHFGLPEHLDSAIALPRIATELGTRGTRVIIEDAHRLSTSERTRLAAAMKIFSDLGDQFPTLMIIAIAAIDTGSLFEEAVETEFSSRISEVRVPLFSVSELAAVVEAGGSLLNVDMSQVAQEIALRSGGLPGVAHALSLGTLGVAGVLETQSVERVIEPESLRLAVVSHLDHIPPHVVARLDRALESPRYRAPAHRILSVLSRFGPEGARIEDVLALASDERRGVGTEFLPDVLAHLARIGGAVVFAPVDSVRFVSGQLHSYWSLLSQPIAPVEQELD